MATLGRGAWVDAALAELVAGGIDAVRVEVLARRLGVTKGSFYWHFEGRQDLLDALLEWFERTGTERVIEVVEAAAPDAEGRLRALAQVIFASSTLADEGEPAIRAWASADGRAAATLSRVDERRVAYVTDLLIGAGIPQVVARRRAAILYRLMIGEFVWRAHGGEPLGEATRDEVVDLVLRDLSR